MEEQKDKLKEHTYDGIEEYDNPLPGWWSFIFLISFVFSIFYFYYYHISPVSTSVAQGYDNDVSEDLKRRFSEIGELTADEETILKYMNEPKWLVAGESTFKAQCISCHGPRGEGMIGPNLTDDHYIHVNKLSDLARVINEGAANGAMPAWKHRLHPNEVVLMASYLANMRGKNIKGVRGPEGNEIPPWPTK
ncbi:MAG: c-type cytochrome [Planctomycetes bacterium]|nr:c-type cytochrome [Planctomycetota bacterium]